LAPSQFYTGLIADLYEPLLSEPVRAEDYQAFLDRVGTPVCAQNPSAHLYAGRLLGSRVDYAASFHAYR
jgi:hypothetical protein